MACTQDPIGERLREAAGGFKGYPVDMAIFDSPRHRGEWDHVIALVETKAPNHKEGISELSTYLGLEPNAVLGIWSDGDSISLVYKQADMHYKSVRQATLPAPGDNVLIPGDKALTYVDLREHDDISGTGLNRLFSDLFKPYRRQ